MDESQENPRRIKDVFIAHSHQCFLEFQYEFHRSLLFGLLLCSVACIENPAPKTVDLRTMLNLISENIVAADKEYKNQHVQLDGEIRVIEKNKVRLVPISSDMFQVCGADCFLTGDEKKQLASLRIGDNFTVTGQVKDINTILVNTVKLEDCPFVFHS